MERAAHTNSSAPSVVVTAADSSLSRDEVAMLLGHIIRLTDTTARMCSRRRKAWAEDWAEDLG